MKTKSKAAVKQVRTRYSPEFKQHALARAAQEGVAVAAKDLGLQESQLYGWRAKAKLIGQTSEEQRLQQSEHARLKREVTRLEEENAFLKKAAVGSTGRCNMIFSCMTWVRDRYGKDGATWAITGPEA